MDLAHALNAVLDDPASATPEQMASLTEIANLTAGKKMIPNQGPQMDAYYSKADVLLYGGQAGGGKLQPLSSKVLTPKGFVQMGDIKVGDKVIDPTTGSSCNVVSLHPQGVVDIWKVTCDDGAETLVGADHLWSFRISGGGKKRSRSTQRALAERVLGGDRPEDRWSRLIVDTTARMIEIMKSGARIRIPLTEPVCFTKNGRTAKGIDPYVAGILLGDGHMKSRTVTSCDDEVRQYLLDYGFTACSEMHSDGKPKSYRATGAAGKKVAAWIANNGLSNSRSWEKHIPDYVFTAPVEYRLSFLRGLMDTDGTIDERGRAYFTSTSLCLAQGVADLVRGLGGKARVRGKQTSFTHLGEKKEGRPSFNVRVWMSRLSAVFGIERKKARATDSWNGGHEITREIVSIEPHGREEAQCIRVSNPYGLYVTDDYIVTHNTILELGWGVNEAESGIIFRRKRNQTDGLEKEGKKLIGSDARFNGQDLEWTWPDGKTLKLAGMNMADDWIDHAGRERDYMGFDEAGEFLEMQVAQIIAWLRAGPGKRCRVILGSNPPRSVDGQWLIKWFAPWLDPKFGFPAKPGELRWACGVMTEDAYEIFWVEGPGEYEIDGETYTAKSYTFIPASLVDNPYRNTPEYRAQLQSLPEPLRSQLLYGDFMANVKDQEGQVIPTAWIKAAQERWNDRPPQGVPMCAMGIDASGGGDDPMVIAPRYDGWFDRPVIIPGSSIPMDRIGSYCAGQVIANRRDQAVMTIDMGGGYGGPIYEHLCGNFQDQRNLIKPYKGAAESLHRTKDRQCGFKNTRSEAYWRLREALDPDQEGGSPVALPPDQIMVADLTAPTFEHVSNKGGLAVKVEPKEKVVEKLGRSPDRGDAVVMAWFNGDTLANRKGGDWGNRGVKPIKVNRSHEAKRRR